MVTIDDVRACALALPRTEEHLIHDHVKFRVGKIVYASVSPDETIMGFGFPREERDALIARQILPAADQRSAVPLGARADGRTRRGRDGRTCHRRLADGGAEAGRRQSPRVMRQPGPGAWLAQLGTDPLPDLLHRPVVAVRVGEVAELAAVAGIQGFHLGDADAAPCQFGPGRLDVRDDQLQPSA